MLRASGKHASAAMPVKAHVGRKATKPMQQVNGDRAIEAKRRAIGAKHRAIGAKHRVLHV
eukprot:2483280-Lingulodinium_polyedra.AAC.2